MTKRVTMMDVAERAGCSQATVSVVLNGVTGIKISADLRARVLESARLLGYGTGSPIRRTAMEELRGGCIGFIVDQLATTPEAVNAMEGARLECWDDDITVLVADTQGLVQHEVKALERLLRAGAQGIVYMSVFTRRLELDPVFDALPVPLVLLNCYTSNERFPSVVPDEINGGRMATSVLVDLGHRRIGTIVGETFMEAAQDRLAGYRKALTKAGIEYDDDLVVAGSWTPSSGYEATRKLLSLPQRPTAIFCQNDKMAVGCFDAIRDAGLRIPDDISVIGYDDDELGLHLRPQLTTLDLPHRAMGAWAVRQIEKQSQGSIVSGRVNRIPCSLVTRHSCSGPSCGPPK